MDNKLAKFVFDGVGIPKLHKFLNLTSVRHKLITGNIANATTPGYRSRQLDFKAELAKLGEEEQHLKGLRTDPGHLPVGHHPEKGPEIEAIRPEAGELNSVDIDREISNLAQNELMFTVGAQLIRDKFEGLRKVITSK